MKNTRSFGRLFLITRLTAMAATSLAFSSPSLAQLNVMISYFLDPAGSRVAIQSHSAHEPQLLCSAATTLQIQANGDVKVCSTRDAIGNFRSQPIRAIWAARPHWWQEGCCLEERLRESRS